MLIILKCPARRRAQPPRSASEMLHQGGANTPSLVKSINSTDFDKKKMVMNMTSAPRGGGAKQHDNEENEDFVDMSPACCS